MFSAHYSSTVSDLDTNSLPANQAHLPTAEALALRFHSELQQSFLEHSSHDAVTLMLDFFFFGGSIT